MKKKRLLAILGMMLFVLVFMVPATGAAAEKPIKLVNNEKEPEGHPWTKVSLRWQEKITQRTNPIAWLAVSRNGVSPRQRKTKIRQPRTPAIAMRF